MRTELTRAERRRIERLERQYDKRGCSRCRKRPSVGAFMVTSDGRVLCNLCVKPHDHVVYTAARCVARLSQGAENDREWFLANPGANHRVRPAFDGEAREVIARGDYLSIVTGDFSSVGQDDPDLFDSIITVQIEPGKRFRFPVRLPRNPEAVPAFVAQVIEKMAGSMWQGMAIQETLPVEHQAIANNAAALLPLDRRVFGGALVGNALAVGQAFREGLGKPRH